MQIGKRFMSAAGQDLITSAEYMNTPLLIRLITRSRAAVAIGMETTTSAGLRQL